MSGLFNGIQAIISAIQTVINAVKMSIEFLINLVKMTIELLRLIATTISNVVVLIATLPPWLTAFATATLGVAVIYLILGRETGK